MNSNPTHSRNEKDESIVYIPPGARVNLDGKNMEPPKTKYEKNKRYFDRDAVKKIIRGYYGSSRDKI